MLTAAFSEGNGRGSDPGIGSGKRLRFLVDVGLPPATTPRSSLRAHPSGLGLSRS